VVVVRHWGGAAQNTESPFETRLGAFCQLVPSQSRPQLSVAGSVVLRLLAETHRAERANVF